jgi:hypothetical protein
VSRPTALRPDPDDREASRRARPAEALRALRSCRRVGRCAVRRAALLGPAVVGRRHGPRGRRARARRGHGRRGRLDVGSGGARPGRDAVADRDAGSDAGRGCAGRPDDRIAAERRLGRAVVDLAERRRCRSR